MGNNGLRSKLKKNSFLRRRIKGIKNYKEFFGDARDFNRYYLEKAEKRGDSRYRLMLLVHNIEKGLCSNDPRPFGEEKVRQIVGILRDNPEKKDEFEYALAASSLKSWKAFHIKKGFVLPEDLADYIDKLEDNGGAGSELFETNDKLLGRRSVRDFEERELRSEDVDFALRYFSSAPTACNRQMCRVYRVKSAEAKELLIDRVLGISGFNTDAVTFFLITFDISAFDYSGERNQGYLNAGLTAMNFVNGLHKKGIGSCFLQWSNKRGDDKLVRSALGLKKSERIAVVIGAGYYKDNVKIPKSSRKNKGMIYKEI